MTERQKLRYQEYEPPIELSSWIKLFWVFESCSNDPVPETIVADGYPELIIHFGSPFAEADGDGRFLRQPKAVACGQLTRPLVLHSSLDAGMIGIRFKPSGMAPFVSTPMKFLTDARVDAESLFIGVDHLIAEILECTNDVQRISACTKFLVQSIDVDRTDVKIQRALEAMSGSRGGIPVESLATLVGSSRRSLELAFQKEVGVSPKMYNRIVRFRYLYDAVSNNHVVNWVEQALDSGFFDQSHLIRDFQRFAGDSPTSFLADQTSFAHSVNQI